MAPVPPAWRGRGRLEGLQFDFCFGRSTANTGDELLEVASAIFRCRIGRCVDGLWASVAGVRKGVVLRTPNGGTNRRSPKATFR